MRSLLLLSPLRLPISNPVFNFFNSNSIFRFQFRFYSRPSHYLRSAITPPTMASPIEESVGVARRCWINFKKESTFALYTPFVVCLASGTLNIDTFRHYIAQDVHFLKAFVQGYEAAEVCTDDDDAKVGISELRKNIVNELKIHDAVLERYYFTNRVKRYLTYSYLTSHPGRKRQTGSFSEEAVGTITTSGTASNWCPAQEAAAEP